MIDSQTDLISVIVPIFKVEKDLPSCVKSIQAQTYTNLEIFLVDDGSPDNCPRICDDFQESDSRIQVIHKKNGGLSDARNVALEKCTGKYVIFVDSDDMLHPEMIKTLYLLCVKNKAEIAVCNYLSVATKDFHYNALVNGHAKNSDIEILSAESALVYMMDVYNNFQVAAWNKMYERRLFDGVRYPAGIYYEDIATTYKLIGKCKCVAYTHEQLYFYQLRDSSITRSGYSSRDLDKIKNSEELLSYIETNYPTIKDYALIYRYVFCFTTIINKTIGSKDKDAIKVRDNLLREIKRRKGELNVKLLPLKKRIAFECMLVDFGLYSKIASK